MVVNWYRSNGVPLKGRDMVDTRDFSVGAIQRIDAYITIRLLHIITTTYMHSTLQITNLYQLIHQSLHRC